MTTVHHHKELVNFFHINFQCMHQLSNKFDVIMNTMLTVPNAKVVAHSERFIYCIRIYHNNLSHWYKWKTVDTTLTMAMECSDWETSVAEACLANETVNEYTLSIPAVLLRPSQDLLQSVLVRSINLVSFGSKTLHDDMVVRKLEEKHKFDLFVSIL